MTVTVHEWTARRQMSMAVDGAGVITDITGDSVDAGGKAIVWGGLGEAEVKRILGRGRVQEVVQPGSGVISIGGREVGRVMTYDNQGVRFEIQLEGDSVQRVRAFRPPAR